MKIKTLFFILILSMTTISAHAEMLEYDVSYSVSAVNDITQISAQFNVYNSGSEIQKPIIIAGLYDNDMLIDMKSAVVNVPSEDEITENLILEIPINKKDEYFVRFMLWENTGNIRPVGQHRTVNDLDTYSREKYVYLTLNRDQEFNIFMNCLATEGANLYAVHTISYDASKIVPIDLCGFTNDIELSEGEILNCGISIEDYNSETGTITYTFAHDVGRNTGINNVIKFKALEDLEDEEIVYSIQ